MKKNISKKIYIIISKILNLKPEIIKKHVKHSKNINNWDSLNHIKIILQIENEFKIKFTQNEIVKSIDNKNTLLKYIEKKFK